MDRITLREMSRLYANAKAVEPTATCDVRLVAVNGDKKLRFKAEVTIGGVTNEVAADNGKIKVFSDVDDFLKFVAKAAESGDGVYKVEVDTGMILASSVPGDMLKWAAGQVDKLTNVKPKQQAVIGTIDAQLAMMVGWENGNQAQQAKKLDTQNQKACVILDIAAIDAEIERLQGLIDGA